MNTATMTLTVEQQRLLRFAALNGNRLSTGRWQAPHVRKAAAALVRMGMLGKAGGEWRHLTDNGQA